MKCEWCDAEIDAGCKLIQATAEDEGWCNVCEESIGDPYESNFFDEEH